MGKDAHVEGLRRHPSDRQSSLEVVGTNVTNKRNLYSTNYLELHIVYGHGCIEYLWKKENCYTVLHFFAHSPCSSVHICHFQDPLRCGPGQSQQSCTLCCGQPGCCVQPGPGGWSEKGKKWRSDPLHNCNTENAMHSSTVLYMLHKSTLLWYIGIGESMSVMAPDMLPDKQLVCIICELVWLAFTSIFCQCVA